MRGRYVANHAGARLEAAMQGWGIASLPEFTATDALRHGGLVEVLADWIFEARAYMGPVWLLYPPNRFLPPKVRVLIDYLAEHLREGGVRDARRRSPPAGSTLKGGTGSSSTSTSRRSRA